MKSGKLYVLVVLVMVVLSAIVLILSTGTVNVTQLYTLNSGSTVSSCVSEEKPNIVLITIDTLRADHLQCYGYPKAVSPNIDQLAEEGVIFLNAISQAPTTPASHASILTGLHPYHHGLRYLNGGTHYQLSDSITTLAEILRENGYSTAAFVSAFPLISTRYNLNQGFECYDEDFTVEEETVNCPLCRLKGIVNTGRSQRRSDETNKKVFRWLKNHSKETFFLWVHYFDPHDVLVIPPGEFLQGFPQVKHKSEKSIDMYDAEIAYTDYQFGELRKRINELGIADNTVFILTSDHGEGLNDHNYWSHGKKIYQEQIHVPLIMRSAQWRGGKKISSLTRSVDIVPTLMDMIGLPLDMHQCDGISLLPSIIHDQPLPRLLSYSETHYPKIINNETPLFSIIDQKWKFIYHSEEEGMSQLFNLRNDPQERNNVIAQHPELTQRFKGYLQKEGVFISSDVLPKPQAMAKDVLKRLQSLGYLEDTSGTEQ